MPPACYDLREKSHAGLTTRPRRGAGAAGRDLRRFAAAPLDQREQRMTGSNGSTAVSDQPALPKPEGLEGVVAASTALSHVLGEEGKLVYRGYDIHELAGRASFEEVAFLLWKGHLPSRDELTQLLRTLGEQRPLPKQVIDVIRDLPATAAPMDALRTGVSALGASAGDQFDDVPDLDEAIALTAKFPGILAAFFRLRDRKSTRLNSSHANIS